jgi:hypothetical protein
MGVEGSVGSHSFRGEISTRAGMAGRPSGVSTISFARVGSRSSRLNPDVEQLGAVERVEEELRGLDVRGGEIQVRGEATRVAGAQLAQRGAALEDDAELECALVVEVLERSPERRRAAGSRMPLRPWKWRAR